MKHTEKPRFFSTRGLAVIGSFGALVMVFADYLLEFGESFGSEASIVVPAWIEMSSWRFTLSLNLAAFFIPLYLAGFLALYRFLSPSFPRAGLAASLAFAYGIVMGSPLIHGVMALNPLIYKELAPALGPSSAAALIEGPMFHALMPTFIIHYVITWIGAPSVLFFLVISGKTSLPRWTALLNPLVFLVLGLGLSYAAPEAASWLVPGSINKGNLCLFLSLAFWAPKTAEARQPLR